MTDPAPETPDSAGASSVASTRALDVLLKRLTDENPDLARHLVPEIEHLRTSRKFGLVFNRHLPESVRLPGHPVKPGVLVAIRNPNGPDFKTTWGKDADAAKAGEWRVTKTSGRDAAKVAFLTPATESTPTWDGPVAASDLVVVRQFGEPVYPGLRPVADKPHHPARIANGRPDDPWHLVINGENHHALQALQFTHRGKVDLIYIDPPYNTGNQGWIYNDKYVDTSKGDASSKWLSFMERRLTAAYDLLKDTGVIIVAIGDDEHHRLRMLMDQVFGPQNFLADVTWQGNVSALAKHTGGGVDYMVIYARTWQAHVDSIGQWKMPKDGVEEVLAAGARAWTESGHDAAAATEALKAWWKGNKSRFDSSLPVYDRIDESGRIYFGGPLGNGLPRPNLQYDLLHPVTGKPVRRHPNGWARSKERMLADVEAGLVIFGPDHTTTATYKQYLDEFATQVPLPSFRQDRRSSTLHLERVLGDKRFPNPKSHDVLMRWFRMVAPRDAVVVDFFGGSGSTTEAVMRLNAEDGGTRQCILVTNNEVGKQDVDGHGKGAKRVPGLVERGFAPGDPEWEARGVFEYVTRPRLSTVVTGVREDGSVYTGPDGKVGLAANVEFFDLTYLDESRVSRAKEFEAIAPLLWMQTGATGARIETEDLGTGYAFQVDVTGTGSNDYAVLFDTDAAHRFLAALNERMAGDAGGDASADDADSDEGENGPMPPPRHIFIVTDSLADYERVCTRLPAGVTTHMLYEAYLTNFEINTGAAL